MRKAKQILLVTSMLAFVATTSDGAVFGRKPKQAPAQAPAATAMSLMNVESDGSRITLRTNGTPAYTSYSPSPDLFVVDLTATSRSAAVAIPTTLPPGVASIAADEVTEMGSRLTRVTFRLSQPVMLHASAGEQAVVVDVPGVASASATRPAAVPVAEAPQVEPIAQAAPVVEEPEVIAEPIVAAAAAAPAVRQEPSSAKAKQVRTVETLGSGDSLELRINGDGAMTYKTFRLDNPARLVIDLAGVNNRVAKSTLAVGDGAVKRVRVAQFKGGSDPVTRVVVDLASAKSDFNVVNDGNSLRVQFGGSSLAPIIAKAPEKRPAPAAVASAPAGEMTVYESAPAPAAKPASREVARVVPASIPAQVPVIADDATWKMPANASRGARPVITSAGDQAPPTRPASTQTGEDVFNEAAQMQQAQPATNTATGQTLTGALGASRTIGGQNRTFTGEPLSLNLKDADVKDVLRTFAQLTGLNIAVDPGVQGTVTVDFVDVPWDQALDIILRQNGLTYVLEGNVMRIGTIDRISTEASASRKLQEEERLNVPLTTVIFKLSYARATEVQGLLREIASPRARIIVDARTNQLIVSEISQYLQTMRNLIDTIDVATRQVSIEARIVETSHLFAQQYGFNWAFGGALDPSLGTGTGLVFPNRIGFDAGRFAFTGGAATRVFGITLTDVLGNFTLDFALNAFEQEGIVRIVSAPRVVTQDNVAAEIQSGLQIPVQTRVNFTTSVQYIDATLRLSVTPQITEIGTVIMDIQVQKVDPFTAFTIEGAAGTSLSTRNARTKLMVRDGATSIIGGIYTTRDNDNRNRLPFVHNLPIIGALFRGHNVSTQHDELLIFITPRIVRG